ncbi:MAG: hypothetical protein II804_04180 [Clostridia bacterium]|nr:hypothetical protein [Clostridia bacterium]
MQAILIALINALFFLSALFCPSLTVDAAQNAGPRTGGAAGFLYGVAEEGVPSREITDSLHITTMSAKTAGGLQHPVGDVAHIAPQVNTDDLQYLIVYLQDMYPTWYYDEAAVTAQKDAGAYDWRAYLETVYYPLLDEALERYRGCDYFDKLVFCPFNESDNAVWFGTRTDGRNAFDDAGRQAFYEAWAQTAERIRAVYPAAKLAGPAYCGFDRGTMAEFLAYTKAHGCVPNVIVYHELNGRSIFEWNRHTDALHEIERGLGIDEATPVVVNEYGMMEENGDPNAAAKYISVIEESGVFGDQAYWLLADNLSNTCADRTTPNSAWWVYRWYAQMGKTRLGVKQGLPAYSEKTIRDESSFLNYKKLAVFGLAAANETKDEIRLLLSGADRDQRLRFTHLNKTALKGRLLRVEIEKVTYQGLGGPVCAPEVTASYTARAAGGRLTVPLRDRDKNAAYLVTISADGKRPAKSVDDARLTRFEFEDGTLHGAAYTYDSAYATTGSLQGMCGGFERPGDGVSLPFTVDRGGVYDLTLIYGKDKDGRSDLERKDAEVLLQLDGMEKTIRLPNTVRSENTSTYTLQAQLSKGSHTLTLSHKDGTYVLDSLLVKPRSDTPKIWFEADSFAPGKYWVVAPADGYYLCDGDTLFLQRGLSVLKRERLDRVTKAALDLQAQNAADAPALFGGAAQKTDADGTAYSDGLSEDAGLHLTVHAPEGGDYALVLTYASGRENGVHAYNIDLVEDFVTVKVNGEKTGNFYCRNTMSFTNWSTRTIPVTLQKGDNEITLTNDSENAFTGVGFAPRIAQVACYPSVIH